MTKNYVCCTWYLRNHTYMIVICSTPLWNDISPGAFFYFFKILIFWVVRMVKGQKMAQNDKKNCPSHFISQEPYIIWSWFMVFMCKRIISPGIFYIFSKFWFSGSIVRKKSKKWPKITKNYVCCTPYQSKHTSFDCVFCCTSLELWHLQILFSFFQNFGFLGC